jgi:hypothetical protein
MKFYPAFDVDDKSFHFSHTPSNTMLIEYQFAKELRRAKRYSLSPTGAEQMVSTEASHSKRWHWWFRQGYKKSLILALLCHS